MSAVGWYRVPANRLARASLYVSDPEPVDLRALYRAPLTINIGFAITDGQSINFPQREFSGTDNFERLTSDVQIDTGRENRETTSFSRLWQTRSSS